RTGRPGPGRAGNLRARPILSTDLDHLAPCGSACGLAALGVADLLDAVDRREAIAYVAVVGPGGDSGVPSSVEAHAPLVVLASPALAARCAWIPAEPGPDAWAVLGLRTGASLPADAAVGRLLLRAAVAGLQAQESTSRVQAVEAWAG